MANTRYELNLNLFLAKRIATAAAHTIKANELFASAKLALDSANVAADQAVLLGVTEAQAAEVYTLVSGAATNTATARVTMKQIEQGVDVG
jgi:hypothetical protein